MTRRNPDDTCRWTRWQLCRLAVGRTLRDEARELARHVRVCPACDGFVDDLASLRAALLRRPSAEPSPERLEVRARVALARELRARLARDVLSVARSETGRSADERWTDLRRLELVAGGSPLTEPDRVALERVLTGPGRVGEAERAPARRTLLALATRLDPLGLDVALAWMGFLVRSGRDDQAQVVADRVLSDWNI